jgi:hypothetical protein
MSATATGTLFTIYARNAEKPYECSTLAYDFPIPTASTAHMIAVVISMRITTTKIALRFGTQISDRC